MDVIDDDESKGFDEEWEREVARALKVQRFKAMKLRPPKPLVSIGIDSNNNDSNGNINEKQAYEIKTEKENETIHYQQKQSQSWHEFYETHENHFFKDRHYLLHAFEPLQNELKKSKEENKPLKILELGCGVGNTMLPLIETYENVTVYGADHAPSAIQILSGHPSFVENKTRCKAMVWDISSRDESPLKDEEGTFDFVILMFVLSAIHPSKMHITIDHIRKLLKPHTGVLLFRDYGINDLAQVRFNPANRISPNHYHRSDGTSTFFFSNEGVDRLMIDDKNKLGKLYKGKIDYVKRVIKNNQTGVVMKRVWINGWYMKE